LIHPHISRDSNLVENPQEGSLEADENSLGARIPSHLFHSIKVKPFDVFEVFRNQHKPVIINNIAVHLDLDQGV
jgi:hypothetical protein